MCHIKIRPLFTPPVLVLLLVLLTSELTDAGKGKKAGSVIVINNHGPTNKGCHADSHGSGGSDADSAATTVVKTSKKGNTIIIKGPGSKKSKSSKHVEHIAVPVPVPVHAPHPQEYHQHQPQHGWSESKVAAVFVPQDQPLVDQQAQSSDAYQQRYDGHHPPHNPQNVHYQMMQAESHRLQRMNSHHRLNQIKAEIESRAAPIHSPPAHHQMQHLQPHHPFQGIYPQHNPHEQLHHHHAHMMSPSQIHPSQVQLHPVFQPMDPAEQFLRPALDHMESEPPAQNPFVNLWREENPFESDRIPTLESGNYWQEQR